MTLREVTPTESDRGRPFFFVVVGRKARWDVLEEGGQIRQTEDERFECIALPGSLVGYGATQEEAMEHVERTLEQSLLRFGNDRHAWWQHALSSLSADKREMLKRVWVNLLEQQRVQDRDGFLFAEISQTEAPRELRFQLA
ncbi:MAG: hypothetical protein KDB80_03660 [Planctomycetes bacterium]|nr:hypothetical protein [Planctomycetota bacterium]